MGPRPDGRGRPPEPQQDSQRPDASMGPRPDGRGRASPSSLPSSHVWSFNGAAAGWPRKAPLCPPATCAGCRLQWGRGRMAAEGNRKAQSPPPPHCFNGAAAGWPRKECSRGPHLASHTSFNGAAAGWPRKVCDHGRPARGRSASMGPRPDGRGRPPAPPLLASILMASMGPRPDGRGRLFLCRAVRRALAASMGPRPDGRGRRGAGAMTFEDASLQWGRGRMAAEGGAGRHGGDGDRLASMGPRPDGRGRRAATSLQAAGLVASMGPRPDGRGRGIPQPWIAHPHQLQWGRGRMAAEGLRRNVIKRAPQRLQWGRGRMAAEG